MSKFTIGRLAAAAGVNTETVRYYQRIGLLTEPPKPAHGYRQYGSDSLRRIRFIRRARQLGFRLGEIRELLDISDGQCSDVRVCAERTRQRIGDQIADLRAMAHTLDALIASCRAEHDERQCPIIDALTTRADGR